MAKRKQPEETFEAPNYGVVEPEAWVEAHLFALGPDHLRLCAVWAVVPDAAEQDGQFDGHWPDLYQWARLADMDVRRTRDLWPALHALKCVNPDRTIPEGIRQMLINAVWNGVICGGKNKK